MFCLVVRGVYAHHIDIKFNSVEIVCLKKKIDHLGRFAFFYFGMKLGKSFDELLFRSAVFDSVCKPLLRSCRNVAEIRLLFEFVALDYVEICEIVV